ncbi:MAG: class I SAM-dependent methyltransferase, partial [Nanoarchaeota archaeon]
MENNKQTDKKLSQEEVWDKIAPLWNRDKMKVPFGDDTKGNIFTEFIEESDKKLLDLGCGSGRNFSSLKEAGFKGELSGVDFSREMLKYAEENAKQLGLKCNIIKSKADKLNFEGDYFDKIICIATLHCIETAEERKNAISEMYRVLKKDGKVLITSWNKTSKRWKNKPKQKYVSWN